MKRLKVFYNSACPVCDAGIRKQRRDMRGGDTDVYWCDVHLDASETDKRGYALEAVRERLHVEDADGRMHIGAAAFTELWHRTPGKQWLARLTSMPVIRQAFALCYKLFAALLYRVNRMMRRW